MSGESNKKMPFHVVSTTGLFRSGHETMEGAEAGAAEANREAERMGLEARYETKER